MSQIKSVTFAFGALLVAAIPVHAADRPIAASLTLVSDVRRDLVRPQSAQPRLKIFRHLVGGAYAGTSSQSRPAFQDGGEKRTCNYIGGNGLVSACW
jgi:hypothetical protein